MLEVVDTEKKIQEDDVHKHIFENLDSKNSFVFNAGAGAGKTYSLIQSLKYLLKENGNQLKKHNQAILCITYTNIATEDIQREIGENEHILISTIHQRLWEVINPYQRQLVNIHKNKLEEEIERLKNELKEDKMCEEYQKLENHEQKEFEKMIFQVRDVFYSSYGMNADDLRKTFGEINDKFPSVLRNVRKFRKVSSNLYKMKDNSNCIDRINDDSENELEVKYSFRHNSDRLERMIISHDTLLEYSRKIIDIYDSLKKIVIHRYPYIFIDEYQDTHPSVISLLDMLKKHADEKGLDFSVGFFGDKAQNIYDGGVGEKLDDKFDNLVKINKKFNRRSSVEIIDVINKVRNDDIAQESIYVDSIGGSAKFINGSKSKDIRKIIDNYKEEWMKDKGSSMATLVLTNRSITELSNFGILHGTLQKTDYYKRNYDSINQDLLSSRTENRGRVPNLLYNTVMFIEKVKSGSTLLKDVISDELLREIKQVNLKKSMQDMREIKGVTFKENLLKMEELCTHNYYIKRIVEYNIGTSSFSYEGYRNELVDYLQNSSEEEDVKKVEELLTLEYPVFTNWVSYIYQEKKQNENNLFTYHGTKGEEFDNVLVILENKFGREKNFFNNYFKNIRNYENLDTKNKEKFIQTRNLFYVACSRAKKNLVVYYLDDPSDFFENIEHVFGEINE